MSELGLIRVIWTHQPDSKEYRATFLALLEEMKEGPYHLLLLDERRLGRMSRSNINWYNEELLPALMAAGVERIGVIGHRDILPLNGGYSADGSQGIDVAYFENVSMAMLWLLGNGKSDPMASNERKRLAALRSYRVLDTEAQASYDDITRIASSITLAPMALISLVDSERQWFKSSVGVAVSETPRAVSFCSHAIENPETVMVVNDATKDQRFATNPMVTDAPHVRFYAGAPLVGTDGYAVGTLCVIDRKPRELDRAQLDSLSALARLVVMQLEYRRLACDLKEMHADLEQHLAKVSNSGSKLEEILDRQVNYLLTNYSTSDLERQLVN